MGWFKRKSQGIFTESKDKKDLPEGLWYKCPKCKQLSTQEDHAKNKWVCSYCDYHTRINSKQYFSLLFDNNKQHVGVWASPANILFVSVFVKQIIFSNL